MVEIEFIYDGTNMIIQCEETTIINKVCQQFATKSGIDIKSVYFLYSGNKIEDKKSFSTLANSFDKERKRMSVIVTPSNFQEEKTSKVKVKQVICPICGENSRIKIENYKVNLFMCKNGHESKNLFLNEYVLAPELDQSKIKCDKCKINDKGNTFNNQFFICLNCKLNLCPLCNSSHDKSHNIINYEKINSICKEHIENYNSYCKICKINLCLNCEKDHITHEKIYYGSILPDVDKIKTTKNELEKNIKQLNKDIDDIIKRLNEYKENINHYCQIYVDIMKNIENKNRTYETLNNIIEISNNDIIQDLKSIIDEKDIKNKFNLILDITDKKGIINNDKITLIYKID